jgi:glucoamylase
MTVASTLLPSSFAAMMLESHIEPWTVTTEGTLVPGIRRHYIRVNPASSFDCADEDPNCGTLVLANQPPGARNEFPAKEIVDAGFLELVRYGIRSADDPIIKDSLRVVDAVLKVDTPYGPAWRRYNHDGYGQREDGSSYSGWGKGRPWPLLTGERGHYEIAAGRDATPFLQALENFSQGIGLMPEQIWDGPDLPPYLRLGPRSSRTGNAGLQPHVSTQWQAQRRRCRVATLFKPLRASANSSRK